LAFDLKRIRQKWKISKYPEHQIVVKVYTAVVNVCVPVANVYEAVAFVVTLPMYL
jgi:hypothetical protein